MNRCSEYIEKISAFIDDELSDEEIEELNEHLDSCEECRNLLCELTEMDEMLAGFAAEPPKNLVDDVMKKIKKKRSYKKHIIALASTAAIVVVVLFAGSLYIGGFGAKTEDLAVENTMSYTDKYTTQDENIDIVLDGETSERADDYCDGEIGLPSDADDQYQDPESDANTSPDTNREELELPYDEEFYGIIVIDGGELPDILTEYVPDMETESEEYYIVPADVFDEIWETNDKVCMTLFEDESNISETAENGIIVVHK